MPMEMNRRNRECPTCKNPTTFNVDGKEWFCNKCLTSTPIEKEEKQQEKNDSIEQKLVVSTFDVTSPEIGVALLAEANNEQSDSADEVLAGQVEEERSMLGEDA